MPLLVSVCVREYLSCCVWASVFATCWHVDAIAQLISSLSNAPMCWHADSLRLLSTQHTAIQTTLCSLPCALCCKPHLHQTRADALLAASKDFQTKLGYPLPPPNGANLSTASKGNAQKYNTLSLVLEQPFKDNLGESDSGAPAGQELVPRGG